MLTASGDRSQAEPSRERPPVRGETAISQLSSNPAWTGMALRPLQRKCACEGGSEPCHCNDEDEVGPVQPQLVVNEPGDEYEVEADRTAELVTQRMAASVRASGGAGNIQKAPAIPRIRPYVQRQEQGSGGSGRANAGSIESRIESASSSSVPIAESARAPLEDRFGVDFSGVRIHTDSAASSLSNDLDALAFTHGRDIYFASGQYSPSTPSGQRLLAHELTHVVQQSGGNGPTQLQRSPKVIQRAPAMETKRYYFTLTGKAVHEAVQSRLLASKKNADLIVEAPIPGATRSELFKPGNPDNFERVGRADLYKSSDSASGAVVGVRGEYKTADLKTNPLNPPRHFVDMRPGGATRRGSGKISSRPGTTGGKIDGAFPTDFYVADLKPLSVVKAGEGWAQIGNYKDGMRNFADQAQRDGILSQGGLPTGHELSGIDIPAGLDYRTIDTEGGKPGEGNLITGKSRYWVAEGKQTGLYYYMNLPHPAPTKAARQKEDDVLNALTPVKKGLAIPQKGAHPVLKRRPGSSKAPRIIQRQAKASAGQRDWDAEGKAWEEQRARWDTDVAKPFLKTTEGKYIEERADAEKHFSSAFATPRSPASIDVAGFKSIELWSGLTGKLFGAVRFKFGKTFDKIVAFYERIREKFKGFQNKVTGISSDKGKIGGWQKTLVSAILSALKVGFVELLKTMFAFFANCFQGIIDKVVRKFTEDLSEEVNKHVEELHKQFEQYSEKFKTEFESRFGRWDSFIADLQDFSKWAKIAADLVTLIRIGVQLISCVSPPALGCLWGLVMQLSIGTALDLVIGTKWFDRNITRPTVQNLIRRFAGPAYQGLLDSTLEIVGLTDYAKDVHQCHEADDSDQMVQTVMNNIPEEGLDGQALLDHRDNWAKKHKVEIKRAQDSAGSGQMPDVKAESERAQKQIRKSLGWPDQKQADDIWKLLFGARKQLEGENGGEPNGGEMSEMADRAATAGLTVAKVKEAIDKTPETGDGKKSMKDLKEELRKAAQSSGGSVGGGRPSSGTADPDLSIRKRYDIPDLGPIKVGPQQFEPPPGQPGKDPTILPGVGGSF